MASKYPSARAKLLLKERLRSEFEGPAALVAQLSAAKLLMKELLRPPIRSDPSARGNERAPHLEAAPFTTLLNAVTVASRRIPADLDADLPEPNDDAYHRIVRAQQDAKDFIVRSRDPELSEAFAVGFGLATALHGAAVQEQVDRYAAHCDEVLSDTLARGLDPKRAAQLLCVTAGGWLDACYPDELLAQLLWNPAIGLGMPPDVQHLALAASSPELVAQANGAFDGHIRAIAHARSEDSFQLSWLPEQPAAVHLSVIVGDLTAYQSIRAVTSILTAFEQRPAAAGAIILPGVKPFPFSKDAISGRARKVLQETFAVPATWYRPTLPGDEIADSAPHRLLVVFSHGASEFVKAHARKICPQPDQLTVVMPVGEPPLICDYIANRFASYFGVPIHVIHGGLQTDDVLEVLAPPAPGGTARSQFDQHPQSFRRRRQTFFPL